MSSRLRELVRMVRACKTAADERTVVARESALIRTALKDDDNPFRARNIAKLLYIQILGYRTDFSQMECLKMTASVRFTEKRMGYLGLILLLNETDEVLMLVTNSLKIDLNSQNQFVVGLALTALGTLSTPDMARDLAPEVERLLGNGNPYVRKKAALCALRIFRKCPDVSENLIPRIRALLNDKNHGVLVTACTIITEMCDTDSNNLEHFKRLLPGVLRILKQLVTAGYSPEHEVGGVADPFLQVKLLRLCRVLGRGDPEAAEAMNDILAQVATNTESSRSSAHAVLYECVMTIAESESEPALRALAINILGRFLVSRDNNIRYVALSTLPGFVESDAASVQRLRPVVSDCLKDGDASIRRRALALAYQLVNDQNVIPLTDELLACLEVEERDVRRALASRIYTVIERHSPNNKWAFDTTVQLIKLAGNFVPDSVLVGLVGLVSRVVEIRYYAARQLLRALDPSILKLPERKVQTYGEGSDDEESDLDDGTEGGIVSDALAMVALWIVGEYGAMLVEPPTKNQEFLPKDITPLEADSVIETIEAILSANSYFHAQLDGAAGGLASGGRRRAAAASIALPPVALYAVTALTKLGGRLPSVEPRVSKLLKSLQSHVDVELQQRSCEFAVILAESRLKTSLLDFLPPPPDPEGDAPPPVTLGREGSSLSAAGAPSSGGEDLVDMGSQALDSGASGAAGKPPASNEELLMDIFATPSTPTAPALAAVSPLSPTTITPQQPAATKAPASLMGIDAMLGGLGLTPGRPPIPEGESEPTRFVAFAQHGLQLTFSCLSEASSGRPSVTRIEMVHQSAGPVFSRYLFQAAVPKYLKLQLNAPSSNEVAPNQPVTQIVRVANATVAQPPVRPLVMRVRMEAVVDGSLLVMQGEVQFPAGM